MFLEISRHIEVYDLDKEPTPAAEPKAVGMAVSCRIPRQARDTVLSHVEGPKPKRTYSHKMVDRFFLWDIVLEFVKEYISDGGKNSKHLKLKEQNIFKA